VEYFVEADQVVVVELLDDGLQKEVEDAAAKGG